MRTCALVALAIVATLVAAGCDGSTDASLWRDDFETPCSGAPCGWTQVAGEAGAVTWIETVPSEHGVQMSGRGVAIARVADGTELQFFDPVSSLQAHVVARCDPGAQLTVLVTLATVDETPLDVTGTATFPSAWDGTRSTFDLFPTDSTMAGAQFIDVVSIVLHKEGSGVCEVDYVSLASQSVPFAE